MELPEIFYDVDLGRSVVHVDATMAERVRVALQEGIPTTKVYDIFGSEVLIVLSYVVYITNTTPALREAGRRFVKDLEDEGKPPAWE
jgi:hypothetical protein